MSKKTESFEENMARLEVIVRSMERGDVSLDESLKLFQEGTTLVKNCTKLLDQVEQKIKKIVVQADGTPAEEDFSDGTSI